MMTVVFAKHGRSEADLGLLEAEIRNGAVLSDHGHACKYNWHNSNKLIAIYTEIFTHSNCRNKMVADPFL